MSFLFPVREVVRRAVNSGLRRQLHEKLGQKPRNAAKRTVRRRRD